MFLVDMVFVFDLLNERLLNRGGGGGGGGGDC
jgi:hypothetical protein